MQIVAKSFWFQQDKRRRRDLFCLTIIHAVVKICQQATFALCQIVLMLPQKEGGRKPGDLTSGLLM